MEWKNNIQGFIPEAAWLNVGTNITRPTDPTASLFNDERTSNLFAKWQSLQASYRMPLAAMFHGFDTEANVTVRFPVDTHNIEKGLIKTKINQSEALRKHINSGVPLNSLFEYVLNDGINLADQVSTRTLVAKNELLSTGKVTIKENNLNLSVDYGVTADQTNLTIDLSTSADVPGQIQSIIDKATEMGVIITGMLLTKRNLTKIRNNTAIQKVISGNALTGATVRISALNAYLSEEFNINTVITNDLQYGEKVTMGTDGRPVVTSKKYYPDNKITFFATNPSGKLGVGLWGDPPELDLNKIARVSGSSVSPYIYVTQYETPDPAVIWTKASALFMPVLYDPSSLFIATITEPAKEPTGEDEEGV